MLRRRGLSVSPVSCGSASLAAPEGPILCRERLGGLRLEAVFIFGSLSIVGLCLYWSAITRSLVEPE